MSKTAIPFDDELNKQVQAHIAKGSNVLMPAKQILEISDFFQPVLEVVDLYVAQGDFYPQELQWDLDKCDKWGISKIGLLKLMSSAGVLIDPIHSKRLDDMSDKNYVSFQVVGAIKKADGSLFPMKGTFELDLEVIGDEIRENTTKKAWNMDDTFRKPGFRGRKEWEDDDGMNRWIASKVTSELLKKRKFKLALAETGAMNRMIRAILTVKGTYTKVEIVKPFVVPRIVFRPNMADPAIRGALLRASIHAVTTAYGSIQSAEHALEIPASSSEETPAIAETSETTSGAPAGYEPAKSEAHVQPKEEPKKEEPKEESPFTVEAPKPKLTPILTIADFEKLEAGCNPAAGPSPDMLASLEDLKQRNPNNMNIALTKPMTAWTGAFRRAFVTKMLLLDKSA